MQSFFEKKKKEDERQKLLQMPKTGMIAGGKMVLLGGEKKPQAQLAAKKPSLSLLEDNKPLMLSGDIEKDARATYEQAVSREKTRLARKEAGKKKRGKRRLRRIKDGKGKES
ncbi:hypothetical protein J4441_05165 [Candidatus Micrarchaeota archaeon]|nr:hypothetical protein [Candidatus Micrarchaeota archaeon]